MQTESLSPHLPPRVASASHGAQSSLSHCCPSSGPYLSCDRGYLLGRGSGTSKVILSVWRCPCWLRSTRTMTQCGSGWSGRWGWLWSAVSLGALCQLPFFSRTFLILGVPSSLGKSQRALARGREVTQTQLIQPHCSSFPVTIDTQMRRLSPGLFSPRRWSLSADLSNSQGQEGRAGGGPDVQLAAPGVRSGEAKSCPVPLLLGN